MYAKRAVSSLFLSLPPPSLSHSVYVENLSICYSKIDSLLKVWTRNDFRVTGVASVRCFSSTSLSFSHFAFTDPPRLSLSLSLSPISEAVEFVKWRGSAKIGLYFIKWETKFSAACKFAGSNPDVHFNTSFLFASLSSSRSTALSLSFA